MKKIILGSASRWRKTILQEAGYKFDVLHANINEKAIRDPDPQKLVLKLAHAKADALLPKIKTDATLITLDQIVVCNGKIFEKPENEEEVWHYVSMYRKYSAQTVTGIVITDVASKKQNEFIDIATVYFNEIPDQAVLKMIQIGEIFHCAGGFQIEGENGKLNPYIKKVDGEIDSVKGLPMKSLRKYL